MIVHYSLYLFSLCQIIPDKILKTYYTKRSPIISQFYFHLFVIHWSLLPAGLHCGSGDMPVSDTCSCPGGNCGLMLQRGRRRERAGQRGPRTGMKTTRREGTATRGTRVQGPVTSSCWAGEGVGTGGRKPEDLLEASPCCQRDRSLTDPAPPVPPLHTRSKPRAGPGARTPQRPQGPSPPPHSAPSALMKRTSPSLVQRRCSLQRCTSSN